jgi:hypothetical protein
VDRRKAHRVAIEQIGQILSIAGIGGGLWSFWLALQIIRSQGFGTRKMKTGKNPAISGKERELSLRGEAEQFFLI